MNKNNWNSMKTIDVFSEIEHELLTLIDLIITHIKFILATKAEATRVTPQQHIERSNIKLTTRLGPTFHLNGL